MKTILFDLDGTLTDPGEGITNSVAYALRHYGIEISDRRMLYPFIGPPLTESFMKYFDFSEEEWMTAIEQSVPAKFLELNKKAFALGRDA